MLFAVAQLLIAGVNLYLLATIVEALLGWPMWVALLVAGLIVCPTSPWAACPQPSTTRFYSSSSSLLLWHH